VLDLKLSYMLREMCLSSLGRWEQLVVKSTAITAGQSAPEAGAAGVEEASSEEKGPDATPASAPAAAYVEDKTEKELAAEAKKARIEEALQLRSTETSFPTENLSPPLFAVELVLADCRVELSPSSETLQGEFIGAIDKMLVEIRGVTSVSKEVMSLLTLDERVLFNIGTGDELCADVDAAVEKTKSVVRARIAKAMERPEALVALFNEFSWILDQSPDDYVEALVGTDSAKAPYERQAEFKLEMARLDSAMRSIARLSFKQENFGFVQVSTEVVRQALISKAIELRNALAQVILEDCRRQNIEVVNTYADILQRIAVKPTSEKELADLRTFIEQAKSRTVVEMMDIVAHVRGSMSMIESFRVPLPLDDVSLAWSTLEYPAKIEHAGKEVEVQLEADKIRMMDRLSLQKDQLEELIEQTCKYVKAVNLQ